VNAIEIPGPASRGIVRKGVDGVANGNGFDSAFSNFACKDAYAGGIELAIEMNPRQE
jgi:hypothetical protein